MDPLGFNVLVTQIHMRNVSLFGGFMGFAWVEMMA